MHTTRGFIVAITVTSCATMVLAVPRQQRPVFRTGATHVLVDVIATDRNGTPVTDLSAADFEIRQKGVRQPIADFEYVAIPAIDRKVNRRAPTSPAPDSFTNALPPPNARAFVFVMWKLSSPHIVPVKRMMASFISAMQPDDEVAIVYPDRSDLSQDFTTDTGRLVMAINDLKAVLGAPQSRWVDYMTNVIRTLADARQQRRVIVFVSEGFGDFSKPPPEFVDVFHDANQRNIPIYTIDPRGLMAPSLGLEGRLEDQRPNGLQRVRAVDGGKEGLKTVALHTNGRAFVNNWNVSDAAAALVGDNNSYYLLGFHPDPYRADGQFHDIDVTVTRPGVSIRARQGYRSESPPDPKAAPAPLLESLGAGLPGGSLVLRAVAAAIAPGAGQHVKTLLTLDVEYPDDAKGGEALDLAWIAIDPDAGVRTSGQHTVTTRLAGGSPRVTIHTTIEVPQGQLTLRAAVSSKVTGTKGTVHIPIVVRELVKTKLEVALLMLGQSPAPPSLAFEIGDELESLPVTPTAARRFTPAGDLRVLARVFAPAGRPVEGSMVLTLATGKTLRVQTSRNTSTRVPGAVDFVGDIALETLPAGRYVLVFTGRDDAAKNLSAQKALTFEVK